MSNVLIGFDTAAKELPVRYTYDPTRGPGTVRTFKGTQAQIEALEVAFQNNKWATDVQQGPVWTLTATLSYDYRDGEGGETPVNNWELFANVVEKDILASDISAVTGLSSARKMYLRDVLDGRVEVKDLDCSTEAKTPAAIYGDTNSVALFKAICAGLKSKRVNVPTLRHTETASRDYQFSSALTGVDEVYSTSALGNVETIPSWIYWNMPPAPTTNPTTRTDGVVVFKGWHKHYPQLAISAFSKSQIVVEWEYGEWSTILYPAYHT